MWNHVTGFGSDPAVLERIGFVYARGWNILAGSKDYKDDVMNAAKVIVVLMLTTAFLYLEDYRYKINGIIDITENYRKLHVIKAFRMLLIILVVYMIVYLPELMWVKKRNWAGRRKISGTVSSVSGTGWHINQYYRIFPAGIWNSVDHDSGTDCTLCSSWKADQEHKWCDILCGSRCAFAIAAVPVRIYCSKVLSVGSAIIRQYAA